jgi:FAD/FMN-containing dehydrogenase
MAIQITRQDERYRALRAGHNLRWPANESDAAERILICADAEDAASALQEVLRSGLRPTVRSGGHCYEDFVANNPGGAILDVGSLSDVRRDASTGTFHVGAGTQLWHCYESLYKQFGVTLPGGVCGTVGAGGHISGGGYGPLSRRFGLTSDLLTAVHILTVDKNRGVVPIRAAADHHPDLFRACRGAGAGNFGMITAFEFADLPTAPLEVAQAEFTFDWKRFTSDKLGELLKTFGEYWETRGQEPETWGLSVVMPLTHRSTGEFSMTVRFSDEEGTCKELGVLEEFLKIFSRWSPSGRVPLVERHGWMESLGAAAGEPLYRRGKYKSAYMKRAFTSAESRKIYEFLSTDVEGVNFEETAFEIHSYGGAVNKLEMAASTAIPQRRSVMKLQPLTYWNDPEQDAAQCSWINRFYEELYSGPDADTAHQGTPYWNEQYEGCYMNYPDVDMLRYDFWPQLYHGDENYAFLQDVKRRYDPGNVFHHAMSIRP